MKNLIKLIASAFLFFASANLLAQNNPPQTPGGNIQQNQPGNLPNRQPGTPSTLPNQQPNNLPGTVPQINPQPSPLPQSQPLNTQPAPGTNPFKLNNNNPDSNKINTTPMDTIPK